MHNIPNNNNNPSNYGDTTNSLNPSASYPSTPLSQPHQMMTGQHNVAPPLPSFIPPPLEVLQLGASNITFADDIPSPIRDQLAAKLALTAEHDDDASNLLCFMLRIRLLNPVLFHFVHDPTHFYTSYTILYYRVQG